MASCFHCNLPVQEGSDYPADIKGEPRHFCCPGCRAVALTIQGLGLDQYYAKRDQFAQAQPDAQASEASYGWLDAADLQHPAIVALDTGTQVDLQLLGITCAACVWLIEQHLAQLPGVVSVQLSQATQRARILVDTSSTRLSELLLAIEFLGYRARLARDAESQRANRRESTEQLIRLGIAAIGMMQVGMYAIALHAGALQGISDLQRDLMRHAALILATLVVFVSARPFFRNAWYALKSKRLTMDVPVSLAIGLAYSASLMATFGGFGEVYFDSVVMFTFFLLLSRFLEHRARLQMDPMSLQGLIPEAVRRVNEEGDLETIPLSSVRQGDLIRVAAGQRIPVDGILELGASQVDESVLTGEFEPRKRICGDSVVAGSLNGEGQIDVRVEHTGGETLLSRMDELSEQASLSRAGFVGIADQWSGRFITVVLTTAAVSAAAWALIDPSKAFWIGLSVLVVACPCALSLATPTSYTAAITGLRSIGVLVRNTEVLEKLPMVGRVVFDKTGTLTLGKASIRAQKTWNGLENDRAMAIATALEAHSSHPFSRAFNSKKPAVLRDIQAYPGEGVQGWLDEKTWCIGKASFALVDNLPDAGEDCAEGEQPVYLSCEGQLQARFCLHDPLRPSARSLVDSIKNRGIDLCLLSGDPSSRVQQVARELGISEAHGGMSPQQKLESLRPGADRSVTLYIGDGINDLPALGQSDISLTLADAPELVRSRTDIGLASGDLRAVEKLLLHAEKVRRVIGQNISWALVYNFSAIPLAALGYVPPWLAAIGMSLSSLIVVLNATRLTRISSRQA